MTENRRKGKEIYTIVLPKNSTINTYNVCLMNLRENQNFSLKYNDDELYSKK